MTSLFTIVTCIVITSSQLGMTWGVDERLSFEVRPQIAEAHVGQSIVVDCEAGGSPSSIIHWLHNGQPITQDSTQRTRIEPTPRVDTSSSAVESESVDKPALRLGSTKSRLYLDRLSAADEGKYTCVALTPRHTIAASTTLHLKSSELGHNNFGKRLGSRGAGVPARIFMWTTKRLEFEGTDVQLFCRAQGVPTPKIRWFDPLDSPIDNSSSNHQYQILASGDLLIKDVNWAANMGLYRCVADNIHGTDEVSTFLYPTTM